MPSGIFPLSFFSTLCISSSPFLFLQLHATDAAWPDLLPAARADAWRKMILVLNEG
ncbi:hypothetical protein GBA52_010080 [Prunus armeniaca]|nr:hypothetical protein GBA52_010080 [Prunus armeniaca]